MTFPGAGRESACLDLTQAFGRSRSSRLASRPGLERL